MNEEKRRKQNPDTLQRRRKARRRGRILGFLLLGLLTLALGLGLGFGARALLRGIDRKREAAEKSREALTAESLREEKTQAPQTEAQSNGNPAAQKSSPAETASGSAAPESEEPTASGSEEVPSQETSAESAGPENPSGGEGTLPAGEVHLYQPEELLPVPDSVGRDTLSEGGWYGGKFVRDLTTGQVTCEWDRARDLQEMLEHYGAIYHKNRTEKVCYLTFDCGGTSDAAAVNEVLDILKEKNIQAVFFIPGEYFLSSLNREGEGFRDDRVAVLHRIILEGHIIGSHTYTHPTMCNLEDEAFIEQLNILQQRLNEALGFDYPLHFYRPPEGACSERDLYLAEKMGYQVTLWSFAYGDYNVNNQPEPGPSLEKMKIGLHDGCVYLLHACSSTNRAVLGELIDFMKEEGYDIRRIDR